MENNCVSLETAKKLKAAGFPQDSTSFAYDPDGILSLWTIDIPEDVASKGVAAPTAQEIADKLLKLRLTGLELISQHINVWVVDGLQGEYSNMAEALAAMWIESQVASNG